MHFQAYLPNCLGVHKFLSTKFGSPPPKRAQNEEKTVKISRESSILTLFPGGGTQFYGQNDLWISGRCWHICQIFEGILIHAGASKCRTSICTCASTGKIYGESFMYWFRAKG